ncbi:hypothetical protein EDD94_3550 [Streptomyces sp. PanSC9]|nr:hypothetical protein EDD94_3550 [Streptomyces sp. PanSC9]
MWSVSQQGNRPKRAGKLPRLAPRKAGRRRREAIVRRIGGVCEIELNSRSAGFADAFTRNAHARCPGRTPRLRPPNTFHPPTPYGVAGLRPGEPGRPVVLPAASAGAGGPLGGAGALGPVSPGAGGRVCIPADWGRPLPGWSWGGRPYLCPCASARSWRTPTRDRRRCRARQWAAGRLAGGVGRCRCPARGCRSPWARCAGAAVSASRSPRLRLASARLWPAAVPHRVGGRPVAWLVPVSRSGVSEPLARCAGAAVSASRCPRPRLASARLWPAAVPCAPVGGRSPCRRRRPVPVSRSGVSEPLARCAGAAVSASRCPRPRLASARLWPAAVLRRVGGWPVVLPVAPVGARRPLGGGWGEPPCRGGVVGQGVFRARVADSMSTGAPASASAVPSAVRDRRTVSRVASGP